MLDLVVIERAAAVELAAGLHTGTAKAEDFISRWPRQPTARRARSGSSSASRLWCHRACGANPRVGDEDGAVDARQVHRRFDVVADHLDAGLQTIGAAENKPKQAAVAAGVVALAEQHVSVVDGDHAVRVRYRPRQAQLLDRRHTRGLCANPKELAAREVADEQRAVGKTRDAGQPELTR